MNREGLPLRFNYPMMATIRELASNERYRIWTKERLPHFKRNTTDEEYKKAYKLMIEDERNPFTKVGLCNLILDEIQGVENQIKYALDPLHYYCPKCDKEVLIADEDNSSHYGFVQMPAWRELSCGHVVNMFGIIKNAKIKRERKLIVEKTLVIEEDNVEGRVT